MCSCIYSQTCNESTVSVNTVFYPNSSTNYNNSSILQEKLFLCGPNTIVYDTMQPTWMWANCRTVYLNAGTIYYSSSIGCPFADYIMAKSNSTIVIKPNANSSSFRITYEPGVTIVNLTSGSVITYTCSSIIMPTVNCAATEIVAITEFEKGVTISPNPAQDELNLEFKGDFGIIINKVSVYNSIGQLLREEEIVFKNRTAKIKTDDLANGIYMLSVKTKGNYIINKRIIISR